MSGPLLSKVQTETRLFVTLWYAGWTFHKPTSRDGTNEAAGAGEPGLPGDVGLLPFVPTLYDRDMVVAAKKEVAAASISLVDLKKALCNQCYYSHHSSFNPTNYPLLSLASNFDMSLVF
jgi:hypothetical protein